MSLLQRARDSGRCPPSLVSEQRANTISDGGFEAAVLQVLEGQKGLSLASDLVVASNFEVVLQMADSITRVPGQIDQSQKVSVLEYRRCIILAIIGSTPPNNAPLKHILTNGFLVEVKSWLQDILSGSVGGVDLLLHMLLSVSELPVTKSIVMSSGLGKAIGAIEKHKICMGTPNEAAIKAKVQKVKDDWNASVKALRGKSSKSEKASSKRSLETEDERSPTKKAKQSSTFSNLLKKVSTSKGTSSPPGNGEETSSAAKTARPKPQDRTAELAAKAAAANGSKGQPQSQTGAVKKAAKRVKWVDHFGGKLEAAREIESTGNDQQGKAEYAEGSKPISWSDRRKRDRLREKELLAKAKKSKIIDDDDDMTNVATMKISAPWRQPRPLPTRENTPDVTSSEMATQASRVSSSRPTRYLSEADVPSSPSPLTDVEQAVDMASQSSSVPGAIPFFAPPPEPAPVPVPAPTMSVPQPSVVPPIQTVPSTSYPPPPLPTAAAPPPPSGTGATTEALLAMALPLFLVGSNLQALQQLAANPNLLNTYVDSNGMYDQQGLMSLVQRLTPNSAPAQPTGFPGSSQTTYQTNPVQNTSYISSSYGAAGGYRGDQNKSENNLHVSGYGLTTTQTDVLALFSPYVKVDEVVMKSGFAFVNTSDPDGARRAKEALTGALLGGSPIRINIAQRRARDGAATASRATTPRVSTASTSLPTNAFGQVDRDQVRDDRGNPATKNLFVAGYGSGTSEQELRNLFSQHAQITGCVMKGTFSFVNTIDKASAIQARTALAGSIVNGGVLRINFAKETGRLGTSFDVTYGPNTRSPYARPVTYS